VTVRFFGVLMSETPYAISPEILVKKYPSVLIAEKLPFCPIEHFFGTLTVISEVLL